MLRFAYAQQYNLPQATLKSGQKGLLIEHNVFQSEVELIMYYSLLLLFTASCISLSSREGNTDIYILVPNHMNVLFSLD